MSSSALDCGPARTANTASKAPSIPEIPNIFVNMTVPFQLGSDFIAGSSREGKRPSPFLLAPGIAEAYIPLVDFRVSHS